MSAARLRGRSTVAGAAAAILVLAAILAAGSPAGAQVGGNLCLSTSPPPISAPPHSLRFGITPLAAGSAGGTQTEPKPEDPAAAMRELERLRPDGRELVLRLNRMLMSDGETGVRRYAGLVDGYAQAGFDSEVQVRYHPAAAEEGDMAAWKRYVETAVDILGRRPGLTDLTITNEANFPVSPNTSDGSYRGSLQAIVVGISAARRELNRLGRPDVRLGFSFAWRWLPTSDAQFWQQLGTLATPQFRHALDYVGLQVYPGLVWPPASPATAAGSDTVEALTLLRDCYMPQAGLGRKVGLWVTENGYATNLGRTEADQEVALNSTLEAVHRYSGTLGVTDYRWFNLRDNDSAGADLFAAVGLLRDDYSEKPAFAGYRDWIKSVGTDLAKSPGKKSP